LRNGIAISTLLHFGVVLAAVYGLAGWVLLVSSNIKAFQLYQRQAKATSR